jgi:hypothetical protein
MTGTILALLLEILKRIPYTVTLRKMDILRKASSMEFISYTTNIESFYDDFAKAVTHLDFPRWNPFSRLIVFPSLFANQRVVLPRPLISAEDTSCHETDLSGHRNRHIVIIYFNLFVQRSWSQIM